MRPSTKRLLRDVPSVSAPSRLEHILFRAGILLALVILVVLLLSAVPTGCWQTIDALYTTPEAMAWTFCSAL